MSTLWILIYNKSNMFISTLISINRMGIVICAAVMLGTIPTNVHANDAIAYQRLQKAGGYLAAADIYENYIKSECSVYLLKKKPITRAKAITEVRATLTSKHKTELDNFLASKKFAHDMQENREFISKWIELNKAEGLDKGFSCGALFSNVATAYKKAQTEWGRVK